MNKVLMTAGAALLAMSTAASAAVFSFVDSSAGPITADSVPGGTTGTQTNLSPQNDVLDALFGPGSSLDGFSNASVQLNMETNLLVELIGWEAGNNNTFTIDGTTVGKVAGDPTTLVGDPLSSFTTGLLSAGLLDFVFNAATPLNSVTNAATTNAINGANFIATFGAAGVTEGNTVWLFFDDNAVPGDNHDDLVIRISAVPLPAGALLLLTGVGAIALRRKKKAA